MDITQYTNVLQKLSNAEAGELIHALLAFNEGRHYEISSSSLSIIYNDIVSDITRKREISAIRSQVGKLGMSKRYNKVIK